MYISIDSIELKSGVIVDLLQRFEAQSNQIIENITYKRGYGHKNL